jgi:hypothetical protein
VNASRILRAAVPLALAAAAAGGCAGGLSYNHDYDPAANFTALRTYIWATPPENSRGVNQMLERRFIMAIDQQLQAKGYQLSTSGEGDFAVNFTLTTSQQTDYNTYYTGMGYRGGFYGGVGMGSSTTRATTYTNGTLIVDIFDVRSRNLVWRGTAAGTIEENASPEQRDMRIQEATAGILRQFPSRP